MNRALTIFIVIVIIATLSVHYFAYPKSIPPSRSHTHIATGAHKLPVNDYSLCDSTYGYPPDEGFIGCISGGASIGVGYRQIIAMPFRVPEGHLDTLQFFTGTIGGNNLVKIQILKANSNLSLFQYDLCVGFNCTKPWGYFIDTNDPNGIAPFPSEATDATWKSCDSLSTIYPFGDTLLTIPSFQVEPQNGNTIVFSQYRQGGLHLDSAESLFLVIENIGNGTSDPDTANLMAFEAGYPAPSGCYQYNTGQETFKYYPANPMFPEGNCGGWWNRGFAMLLAFRGVFAGDPPPQIPDVSVSNQFVMAGQSQQVDAWIYDCNYTHPESAGVAWAVLEYTLNSLQTFRLPMTSNNSTDWIASIPAQPVGTTVNYRVLCADLTGNTDSSGMQSYRVVDLESKYFRCDTTTRCSSSNIASVGTVVDTSQFFLPPVHPPGSAVPQSGYDGTAGPFPLGGPFIYFGDTMYYAWIGVDGAIALSKSPTDTIDLSAGGFYYSWTFPGSVRHNRRDTTNFTGMPKNFIAPYWADWIYALDSVPGGGYAEQFGHIRYYEDSTKFVAEWDSVGEYIPYDVPTAQPTNATFRVVLNKIENSVEFQYDDVGGVGGYDSMNLIGMQGDSTAASGPVPGYNIFNENGHPYQTHIHNGMCVKYIPILLSITIGDGWDLISVPTRSPNNSFSFLFPSLEGHGFIFINDSGHVTGYTIVDSVEPGKGFWIKSSGGYNLPVPGVPVYSLTIPLSAGWNMIGSVAVPVSTSSVCWNPPLCDYTPTLFSYNPGLGYSYSSGLMPGSGFFVRSQQSVSITLTGAPGAAMKRAEKNPLESADRLLIQDAGGKKQALYLFDAEASLDKLVEQYALPPPVMNGFDARFGSNSMIGLMGWQSTSQSNGKEIVVIKNAQYPITVTFNSSQHHAIKISESGRNKAKEQHVGPNEKFIVKDPNVSQIFIGPDVQKAAPKSFALYQNYPNPFNPATVISYDVPVTGRVTIKIFNLIGQEAATLVDGEQEAGSYQMSFDGSKLSSGLYFYRMNAGSFTQIKKMLLLK